MHPPVCDRAASATAFRLSVRHGTTGHPSTRAGRSGLDYRNRPTTDDAEPRAAVVGALRSGRVVRGHPTVRGDDVLAVACADGDEDGAFDVFGWPPNGDKVSGHIEEATCGDFGDSPDVSGGVAGSAVVDDEALADGSDDVEPAAAEDVDTAVRCGEQPGRAGDTQERLLVVIDNQFLAGVTDALHHVS